MGSNVIEFLLYGLTSLVSLIADFSVFSAGIRLFGIPWAYSATLGFVVGVLVNYALSIKFVFSEQRLKGNRTGEFVVFSTIGIIGLLITQGVLYVGIELLRTQPEVAKIFATAISFLANYFLRKYLLFRTAAD